MSLKIGDKVKHKTKLEFDMIIISKATTIKIKEKELIEQGHEYFKCRYYNETTNQWEEISLFDFELDKIDD